MTLPLRCPRLLVLAAALCLTACADYEFAGQDVALAYDTEADVVTLTVDSRGLYPASPGLLEIGNEDAALQRAATRVKQVAEGSRYLYLLSSPLILDLGAEPKAPGVLGAEPEISEEMVGKLTDAELRAMVHVHGSVSVVESSLRFDDLGEAALAQTVRIEGAQACFAAVNGYVSEQLTAELKKLTVSSDSLDEMFQSQASIDNVLAYAASGKPFIELTADALELHVPMVPTDVAVLMKSMVTDAKEALDTPATLGERRGAAAAVALCSALGSISVAGHVVTFRFPMDEKGVIRWTMDGPRSEGARALAAALR